MVSFSLKWRLKSLYDHIVNDIVHSCWMIFGRYDNIVCQLSKYNTLVTISKSNCAVLPFLDGHTCVMNDFKLLSFFLELNRL